MKNSQHKIVYEKLRQQIEKGTYAQGDLLPSENQLCSLFGITRPTVRQALIILENEGYIKKHQGKGSIVQAPKSGIGILSIEGTTSGIGQKELITEIISSPQLIHWPDPFWYELTEAELSSGCIVMERLRKVEGKPVLFEISYLPNIALPNFTRRSFKNKSLFDTLRQDYNIKITNGEQKIWSIKSDEKISQLLNIAMESPILHFKRKIATSKVGFHIYSSLFCNTDLYYLQGTF